MDAASCSGQVTARSGEQGHKSLGNVSFYIAHLSGVEKLNPSPADGLYIYFFSLVYICLLNCIFNYSTVLYFVLLNVKQPRFHVNLLTYFICILAIKKFIFVKLRYNTVNVKLGIKCV